MAVILVVEDDTNINNLLKETLENNGYVVKQAFSGTEARMLIMMDEEFDLVLLDLMLPGISGEEVLSLIRSRKNVPVIITTAKDDLDKKVDLLTDGADDYITKPFQLKEVLARIQVQLRHAVKDTEASTLTHKNMTLDMNNYQVSVDGIVLSRITKQEFEILSLLFKHPGQVFSKEAIFEYAWNEPYMGETKTLDVHISNIRKKIKQVTDEEFIETVWGIGYKLHG